MYNVRISYSTINCALCLVQLQCIAIADLEIMNVNVFVEHVMKSTC